MGDGDGWVRCDRGHRHWGRYGAAGLLIRDGESFVLQHRAPWTHEGDTWGVPGGARDSHEDAVQAATREASEEAAVDPTSIRASGLVVDDHGGWSYTSVLGRPLRAIAPHAANAESTQIRWWDGAEIGALPLHRGFANTWPILQHMAPALTVVVDLPALEASADNAVELVLQLARFGVTATKFADGLGFGGLATVLPQVWVVGGPAEIWPISSKPDQWWHRAIAHTATNSDTHHAVLNEVTTAARQQLEVVLLIRPAPEGPASPATGPMASGVPGQPARSDGGVIQINPHQLSAYQAHS